MTEDSANKIIYSNCGPPCWEFVDEKWKRIRASRQKYYHIDLANRIAAKQKDIHKRNKIHRELIHKVGPEWYQELSPKQIETCDNLINCLVKDFKENTINNTQRNIGRLGILPRPNHKLIEIALKQSNQCPVEFLLILYQLIKPNRQKYSLNDRLLLSAVVHLTMEDTLRELHIRIPSPPQRKAPSIEKQVKKKLTKTRKYNSPYLVPFDFVPKSPKFTGVYKKKHLQLPESQYFDYKNQKAANNRCSYKFDVLKSQQQIQNVEESLLQPTDGASNNLTGLPTCQCKEKNYTKTDNFNNCFYKDESNNNNNNNKDCCATEPLKTTCFDDKQLDNNNRENVESICVGSSIMDVSDDDNCSCQAKIQKIITNLLELKRSSEVECDCLEKFQEKVTKYTNYVNRIKARFDFKQLPNKYYIGGVVQTQNGPICDSESFCCCTNELNNKSRCVDDVTNNGGDDVDRNGGDDVDNNGADDVNIDGANENCCTEYNHIANKNDDPTSSNYNNTTDADTTTNSINCKCVQPLKVKTSSVSAKQISNTRILNLNKIPTKYSKQLKLLQQVLEGMALDGFPLAKLPDSYKLPHFKLWMEFRCKKTWTQNDRQTLLKMSTYFWKHTDICYKNIKTKVKLPISKEKANELTWAHATYSKKIVSKFVENYYKKVRQENVNSSREFFPTTYSYEFPTKGFRDCYFAYLSSKEEDCIVKKVWLPNEFKKGTKQT